MRSFLARRPNGMWYVVVTDRHGHQKKKSTHTRNMNTAEKVLVSHTDEASDAPLLSRFTE